MTKTGVSSAPDPSHRSTLMLATGALVGVALLVVGLIAGGIFDPRPYGSLIRTDHPATFTHRETAESFVPQSPPWSSDAPDRFSMRLTAAMAGGEEDSGYGMALVTPSGRLVVGVSPLGYAAVLEESAGEDPAGPMTWRPWPHVRTGPEANEIWLDVDNEGDHAQVTAWINREQFWQGELDGPATGVGLWQTTFGEPSTVDFRSLEWYADPATDNP